MFCASTYQICPVNRVTVSSITWNASRHRMPFSHKTRLLRLLPHKRPRYGALHSSTYFTSLCSPIDSAGVPSSTLPSHSHSAAVLMTRNRTRVIFLRC